MGTRRKKKIESQGAQVMSKSPALGLVKICYMVILACRRKAVVKEQNQIILELAIQYFVKRRHDMLFKKEIEQYSCLCGFSGATRGFCWVIISRQFLCDCGGRESRPGSVNLQFTASLLKHPSNAQSLFILQNHTARLPCVKRVL